MLINSVVLSFEDDLQSASINDAYVRKGVA